MLKSLLPKSDFAKNVLTLMTGTTIAQAIPILFSPILTRMYTDEDFGIFASFNALVLGLVTIAALRYDLTIVLPKQDKESKALVSLTRKISFGMMILITVGIAIFITPLSDALKSASIKEWFYIIGLIVFIYIQTVIIQMYLNRKQEYKTISKSRMLQGGGVIIAQIALGLWLHGFTGLILGSIFGQILCFLYLFKKTNTELKLNHTSKAQDIALMKKYKKMPLLNGPNAVVDSIRLNGINIILIHIFSSAILGQFSLAWRVLQAPLGLINGAFSQVYFQQLSTLDRSKHYKFLKKSIKRSFLLGIIPFSILYFFAPILFSFVFGKDWKMAGEIGSILVPWLFLNLITSPISSYFIVVGKQGTLLLFAIFYMLVPFITIWYFQSDSIMAMKGLSYSMSFMLIIFLIMVLYFSKNDEKLTAVNE